MGGLFTASVRSPPVGIVLTMELTAAYDVVVPLVATCLCASLAARWLGGKPIYEQLLERTLALAGRTRDRTTCAVSSCLTESLRGVQRSIDVAAGQD